MVRLPTAQGSILHFFLSETDTSTSFTWYTISQLVYNSQPLLWLSHGYLVLLKGIWEGGTQFWVTDFKKENCSSTLSLLPSPHTSYRSDEEGSSQPLPCRWGQYYDSSADTGTGTGTGKKLSCASELPGLAHLHSFWFTICFSSFLASSQVMLTWLFWCKRLGSTSWHLTN